MKRAIVVPAVLADAALDGLKDWLAITSSRDDASLTALLRTALETCEAFTGLMPLEATCEEMLARTPAWQPLRTRPVQAVLNVDRVLADGDREPLAPQDYAIELDANSGAQVRILRLGRGARFAVRFAAGSAVEWSALPEGIRHGVLRLAAYHYRQRDSNGMDAVPPAAVVALWRPWRRMRLA